MEVEALERYDDLSDVRGMGAPPGIERCQVIVDGQKSRGPDGAPEGQVLDGDTSATPSSSPSRRTTAPTTSKPSSEASSSDLPLPWATKLPQLLSPLGVEVVLHGDARSALRVIEPRDLSRRPVPGIPRLHRPLGAEQLPRMHPRKRPLPLISTKTSPARTPARHAGEPLTTPLATGVRSVAHEGSSNTGHGACGRHLGHEPAHLGEDGGAVGKQAAVGSFGPRRHDDPHHLRPALGEKPHGLREGRPSRPGWAWRQDCR